MKKLLLLLLTLLLFLGCNTQQKKDNIEKTEERHLKYISYTNEDNGVRFTYHFFDDNMGIVAIDSPEGPPLHGKFSYKIAKDVIHINLLGEKDTVKEVGVIDSEDIILIHSRLSRSLLILEAIKDF